MVAVALLLVVFGSPVELLADAVFHTSPLVISGRTTIVTVAVAPDASVPRSQLIALVPLHVPCVVVVETHETSAGSESLSLTLDALSGPPFDTVIV